MLNFSLRMSHLLLLPSISPGLPWWDSLVAHTVKNLPAMQETWIRSLGWEDLLEKAMATPSSILAWKIPRTEESGRLQSMGSQSQTQLSDFTSPCLLNQPSLFLHSPGFPNTALIKIISFLFLQCR